MDINERTDPATDLSVPCSQLLTRWTDFPFPVRSQILHSAAEASHRLWHEGINLSHLSLDRLTCLPDRTPPEISLRTPLATKTRRRLPVSAVQSALAGWYAQVQPVLSLREIVIFVRKFLALESVDYRSVRPVIEDIHRAYLEREQEKAAFCYRTCLSSASCLAVTSSGLRGAWQPAPELTAADLHGAIREAETASGLEMIKSGPSIRVFRARLLGRDALIKRYELRGGYKKLKYWLRPSRGRRAFAAARTLTGLGQATPEPLGFLEERSGGCPGTSYFITEYRADAQPARTWIENRYPDQPDADRREFRRQLLSFLLDLYRHGIYHADTKSSNMLLEYPEDPGRRRWLWIDLECMEFGVPATARRVYRNLVQLNGSLGPRVTRDDRLDFLRELARTFPWVAHPWIVRRIGWKTWWRLKKEEWGWAGQ